jgi:hypothetical protein
MPPCPKTGGSRYRSHIFREALGGVEHRRTQPYRPQTNGRVERFHRTLLEGVGLRRFYTSAAECCEQYPVWLHTAITAAATPHSVVNHPPAACLTSRVSALAQMGIPACDERSECRRQRNEGEQVCLIGPDG